jgi:uncharacterized protein (TIGR00266 family)
VLQHQVVGDAMQMVVCTLTPGQVLYAEAGKFLFRSGDVAMETKLSQPSAQGSGGGVGGLLRGALDAGKRMAAGESFAFQHFTTRGGDGLVALAGVLPGEMRAIEINPGETWMAEKDAFVGAEGSVRFDVAFSGLRSGFAGGEGFVLEKFTSDTGGTLFLAGAGNFIDINPAEYGGTLYVDTGCIVAFEDKVQYGVERIGGLNRAGIMNAVFGGEGLSQATLTGDGRVILQSMTIDALAKALQKNMGAGDRKTGGGLGGIFGGSAD